MITDFHAINRQLPAHERVHRFDRFLFQCPAPDVRLIGGHDEQKARRLQFAAGFGRVGENFKLAQAGGRIGLAVAHQSAVDDAVAIQKDSAPPFGVRISDFGLHLVLSHLVRPIFSFGWDTKRCQTTA